MENLIITIKLNKHRVGEFIRYYQAYKKANNGPYISLYAIKDNVIITLYHSSKERDYDKVTFSGQNAKKEALIWSTDLKVATLSTSRQPSSSALSFLTYSKQYGSDEVGFGDFFGPLVVVAAYLDEIIYQELSDFVIKDSKKMDDSYIMTYGPLLAGKVKHKVNIVDPVKFNELTKKGYNMNKIKAMLHLNVLTLLHDECQIVAPIYIDKFASEENFSLYVEGMRLLPNITMKEKGESLYPSVALASVLARYYFLKEMAKLNAKYQTIIPLGASTKVDEFAQEFKKKHGQTALDKLVKQNFRNYQRLVA